MPSPHQCVGQDARFSCVLSIVLQKLEHDTQCLRAIHVGVTSALILAALDERDAIRVQVSQLVLHPLDLEGNVMEALAVRG